MSAQRRTSVKVTGKILYLTEDAELLKKQLRGEAASPSIRRRRALVNNISTDELTPGWVCYYYDETLARYCLVGLRGGVVAEGRASRTAASASSSAAARRAAAARARRRRTASSRRA